MDMIRTMVQVNTMHCLGFAAKFNEHGAFSFKVFDSLLNLVSTYLLPLHFVQ